MYRYLLCYHHKLILVTIYIICCVINIRHVRIITKRTRCPVRSFAYYNVCSFIPILWVIFLFRVTVYVIKWSSKRMRLARTHRTTTTAAAAYRYPCFLNYRLLFCVCVCVNVPAMVYWHWISLNVVQLDSERVSLVSYNWMWNSINQKFSEVETYFPEDIVLGIANSQYTC